MKLRLKYAMIISTFLFASCGIVKVSLNSKTSDVCDEKYNQCEQCKIQPQSGSNRDLRYGYYYDTKEKKCKMILYSSGDGCIPAPFNTMEECKACCCD
jgi:hypothetical protein